MSIGARRPVLPVVVVCCLLTGWLVWACTPAMAGTGFGLASSFALPGGSVEPDGLAVDDTAGLSKGDVYISDQAHNKLDKFTATGQLLAEVEIPGAGLGQLTVEEYPNLADEGDVYVAGYASGTVYQLGPELAIKQEIKGVSQPAGIAVDEAGNVLVAEYDGNEYNAKVVEFNAAGEPINAAGSVDSENTVVEGLIRPQGLAVDASGKDLYVADNWYYDTLSFTRSGSAYVSNGEPFDSSYIPSGVAIAPSGNVFIDQGSQALEYEPSGGAPLDSFGSGILSGHGYGIGVNDESNTVYIADQVNDLVYIFEEDHTQRAADRSGKPGLWPRCEAQRRTEDGKRRRQWLLLPVQRWYRLSRRAKDKSKSG